MDWSRLLSQIDQHCNLGDVKELCLVLDVDFENLGGEGKRDKARELIIQLRRDDRIDDLVEHLLLLKPTIPWQQPAATDPYLDSGSSLDLPDGRYAARQRPLMGGSSIGHYRGGTVTLSGLVVGRRQPQELYLLTCLSGLVPADSTCRAGDPILQPGKADGGDLSRDHAASLFRWGALSDDPLASAKNVPAAIARVLQRDQVSPLIQELGYVQQTAAAAAGTAVRGVGRTSGLVSGEVKRTGATVEFPWPAGQLEQRSSTGNGDDLMPLLVSGVIVCTPMLAPGDAGMLLLDEQNNAVGLGFYANAQESFFLPLQQVLDQLGVDLVTESVWQRLNQPPEPAESVDAGERSRTRPVQVTAVPIPEIDDNAQIAAELAEIKRQLQRGRLVLFIGADFAQEVTGLSSRQQVADRLSAQHGLPPGGSLAAAAQASMGGGSRQAFTGLLRQESDTFGKSPQPLHQAIVQLARAHQFETILTTAYDDLLEMAFRQAGAGLNVVVRPSDLSYVDPGRPTLIRLHGLSQQPDTLVVTEKDQRALFNSPLMDEARHASRRSSVLYLGHDLSDPTVAALMDEVAGEHAPLSYAIWSGLTQRESDFFRQQRKVAVIPANPLQILTALLS